MGIFNRNLAGTALACAMVSLALISILGCSLTSLIGLGEPTSTATPTRTLRPTFTPTVTYTPTPEESPTPTATHTPTETPTPQVTDTPTPAPVPPTPTRRPATPTRRPATPTPKGPKPTPAPPAPNWEFVYVDKSIRTFGNCGGPFFKAVILGQGGVRTNGVAVHFWFFDQHDCRVSGEGQGTGEVGFDPGLHPTLKNTNITFNLQVVNSCDDWTPRSDVFPVLFDNACAAGQFENITFRYNW